MAGVKQKRIPICKRQHQYLMGRKGFSSFEAVAETLGWNFTAYTDWRREGVPVSKVPDLMREYYLNHFW